jgi:hypothetical protein
MQQAAGQHPPVHRGRTEPHTAQLGAGHHTVLGSGKRRNPLIPTSTGRAVNYFVILRPIGGGLRGHAAHLAFAAVARGARGVANLSSGGAR